MKPFYIFLPVLLASALPAFAQAPAAVPPPSAAPAAPAAPSAAAVKPAPATPDADGDDDKTFPAQSTVAAKTEFGTVAASDPAVTGALDAKALDDAKKQAGKTGAFQGTVTSAYSPKTHAFVALDFAPHYKEALTAQISPADYAKLPDLRQLAGKHVLVSGPFTLRGSTPQINVSSPDQIKIVTDKP